LILGLILTGWAFVVVARLFGLQILGHDDFARLARRQQETVRPIGTSRGSIFDRNGNILAISSGSHKVVVNPKRIPNKEIGAALLARILGLEANKLQSYLEIAAQSKTGSGYYMVDDQVTDEQVAALKGMNLDWLEIREGSVRTYPNGPLAAHVIGNVDGHGNVGRHWRSSCYLSRWRRTRSDPAALREWLSISRRAVEFASYSIAVVQIRLSCRTFGSYLGDRCCHCFDLNRGVRDRKTRHAESVGRWTRCGLFSGAERTSRACQRGGRCVRCTRHGVGDEG